MPRRPWFPVLAAVVTIVALLVPAPHVAAEKPTPVQVTNVPLAVTVPRPFAGRGFYEFHDGQPQTGGAVFSAPANSVIETISVQVTLPAGQKPSALMLLPNDTGQVVGFLCVPVQFQRGIAGYDVYVGTLTNAHVPMGSTTLGRQVNFLITRDDGTGIGGTDVTVIGLPPAQ
jgi:hypothetical protein